MKSTHRSRLSLLLIVLCGTIAVPVVASTATGIDVFGNGSKDADLLAAPPPFLFMILGVSMVAWAIGRRHYKSLADVRAADSEG